MRDPARIEKMLAIIRSIWYANPDLRLMQLLINVLSGEDGNLFYIEDETLYNELRAMQRDNNFK